MIELFCDAVTLISGFFYLASKLNVLLEFLNLNYSKKMNYKYN